MLPSNFAELRTWMCRGVALEMLLSKLMAAKSTAQVSDSMRVNIEVETRSDESLCSNPHLPCTPTHLPPPSRMSDQIVCMSATMAGLEPMADWLAARLFLTNFR